MGKRKEKDISRKWSQSWSSEEGASRNARTWIEKAKGKTWQSCKEEVGGQGEGILIKTWRNRTGYCSDQRKSQRGLKKGKGKNRGSNQRLSQGWS